MKKLTTMDDYQKKHRRAMLNTFLLLLSCLVFEFFWFTFRMTTIYFILTTVVIRILADLILILLGKKQESNSMIPYIKITEYSFFASLIVSLVRKTQPSVQDDKQMSPKAVEFKQRITAYWYYLAFMLPLFIVVIIAICQMNAMDAAGTITLCKPEAPFYNLMHQFNNLPIV